MKNFIDETYLVDVGGGNGFVSQALLETDIQPILVEPGYEGAKAAKARGIKHVFCGLLDDVGFTQGTLPSVGLFDVIEHIEDDASFMSSIESLLAPEGYVFATVPAHNVLWSSEDTLAGHYRRYNLQSISTLFADANLEVVYESYIFRPLPLPIYLVRSLPYRFGLGRTEVVEESIASDHIPKSVLVSRIVDWFLRSEVLNIGQGKKMDFGASCLIVGRKRT